MCGHGWGCAPGQWVLQAPPVCDGNMTAVVGVSLGWSRGRGLGCPLQVSCSAMDSAPPPRLLSALFLQLRLRASRRHQSPEGRVPPWPPGPTARWKLRSASRARTCQAVSSIGHPRGVAWKRGQSFSPAAFPPCPPLSCLLTGLQRVAGRPAAGHAPWKTASRAA